MPLIPSQYGHAIAKTLFSPQTAAANRSCIQLPPEAVKPKRLTFEGDYNAPRIRFARWQTNRHGFTPTGVTIASPCWDIQSGNLRVLTKGGLDESPSFAPNGSMILYASKQGNRAQLSAVSIDGQMHQQLSLDAGEVREPAWSPI